MTEVGNIFADCKVAVAVELTDEVAVAVVLADEVDVAVVLADEVVVAVLLADEVDVAFPLTELAEVGAVFTDCKVVVFNAGVVLKVFIEYGPGVLFVVPLLECMKHCFLTTG